MMTPRIRRARTAWLLIASLLFVAPVFAQDARDLTLWYDEPSGEVWERALPVGNGRLGAMVYGNPAEEQLQLNENTVWAGSPHRNDNPAALEALPRVRELMFQGRHAEAQQLAGETFFSGIHGMMYQPVGSLVLAFPGHEEFDNYRRELDLEQAVATTRYTVAGVTFQREVIASAPDDVIAMRMTADQPGRITFDATLPSPQNASLRTENGQRLVLTGTSSDHEGVPGKVRFQAIVEIRAEGGTTTSTDSSLSVIGADAATIYISIGTNFVRYDDLNGDASAQAERAMEAALRRSYADIRTAHIVDYRSLFDRVHLDLGRTAAADRPTDDRVADFDAVQDPHLVALYFQFGRYLLIASSRPGTEPANLQGIWNRSMSPPWDSKYTLNINAEMNYWPAELTALSELHEPFIRMVRELSETGRETARVMYGAHGWVAHHNTDIWRITGPVDGVFWGMWPTGGAWLTHRLWERYLYTGDEAYLADVYPVMKSAAEFFVDFLVEHPEHGWLVVVPSNSPENAPSVRRDVSIAAGATMDNQLVFELFANTISAARELGIDGAFVQVLEEKLAQLPPMHVGRFGQLQEWLEDLDDPNDHHRHVSHLFGLYPAGQISPYRTPALFQAARTSLEHRGDVSTGWSMGWKVNLWARLLDGNRALKLIESQLAPVNSPRNAGGGGTYPNLFDAHPPFQIDGNFGCTAGIAEMLLQSHDGAIHLLPALPDAWSKGRVAGLRARGGFVIDSLAWEDGQIASLTITSTLGGVARFRTSSELVLADGLTLPAAEGDNQNPFYATDAVPGPIVSRDAPTVPVDTPPVREYDLQTEAGRTYTLRRAP